MAKPGTLAKQAAASGHLEKTIKAFSDHCLLQIGQISAKPAPLANQATASDHLEENVAEPGTLEFRGDQQNVLWPVIAAARSDIEHARDVGRSEQPSQNSGVPGLAAK